MRHFSLINTAIRTWLGTLCYLMLCTYPAYADWTYIASVEKARIYAAKEQNFFADAPQIYVLYDYGEVGEYGDLSSIYRYRANCSTGYVKIVQFQYFSEAMGKGDVVRENTKDTDWECPLPKTMRHHYWLILCQSKESNRIADLTTKLLHGDHHSLCR